MPAAYRGKCFGNSIRFFHQSHGVGGEEHPERRRGFPHLCGDMVGAPGTRRAGKMDLEERARKERGLRHRSNSLVLILLAGVGCIAPPIVPESPAFDSGTTDSAVPSDAFAPEDLAGDWSIVTWADIQSDNTFVIYPNDEYGFEGFLNLTADPNDPLSGEFVWSATITDHAGESTTLTEEGLFAIWPEQELVLNPYEPAYVFYQFDWWVEGETLFLKYAWWEEDWPVAMTLRRSAE